MTTKSTSTDNHLSRDVYPEISSYSPFSLMSETAMCHRGVTQFKGRNCLLKFLPVYCVNLMRQTHINTHLQPAYLWPVLNMSSEINVQFGHSLWSSTKHSLISQDLFVTFPGDISLLMTQIEGEKACHYRHKCSVGTLCPHWELRT